MEQSTVENITKSMTETSLSVTFGDVTKNPNHEVYHAKTQCIELHFVAAIRTTDQDYINLQILLFKV